MLVSHYLNQKEALKKEFHELGGFVLILGASLLPQVAVTVCVS